jgi:DNA-binding NarL/FixJ family response regulator
VILEQLPDVVLLDLRLPHLSGIEVMKQVRADTHAVGVRFLVLTTYDADEYIVPALSAGAQGYLLKDTLPDELTRAIRSLAAGGSPLEPGVAAKLLTSMTEREDDELSAREMDVLRLLVAGASNKGIAAQLNLSENTVKSHLSHIFGKLQVSSRAEAVAVALQRGIVPLDRST